MRMDLEHAFGMGLRQVKQTPTLLSDPDNAYRAEAQDWI
jgi:hypothetical protein